MNPERHLQPSPIWALLLLWAALLLDATSCATREPGEHSSGATTPLTLPPTDDLHLTGQTGRNLTLHVSGLKEKASTGPEHRVCALALSGVNSSTNISKTMPVQERQSCSSERDDEGRFHLYLAHLPYPAYITIFHDENTNGILDFATFDILVAKKTGPAEGVGVLLGDDQKPWPFSRPIWIDVGQATHEAVLHYADLPFEHLVKETLWSVLFGLYVQWAKELNNPKNPKSPTNTIGPPPPREGIDLADP